MCLTIYESQNYDIGIADKDYRVYKVLADDLRSPYQRMQYQLRKVYHGKLDILSQRSIKRNGFRDIKKGFHYCLSLEDAIAWRENNCGSRKRAVIFMAIIPKGARYIDNYTAGLGVADTIKITSRCKE